MENTDNQHELVLCGSHCGTDGAKGGGGISLHTT